MNEYTKPMQKMRQRGSKRQLLLSQSWKRNIYMESNREKTNINIAIWKNQQFDNELKKNFNPKIRFNL